MPSLWVVISVENVLHGLVCFPNVKPQHGLLSVCKTAKFYFQLCEWEWPGTVYVYISCTFSSARFMSGPAPIAFTDATLIYDSPLCCLSAFVQQVAWTVPYVILTYDDILPFCVTAQLLETKHLHSVFDVPTWSISWGCEDPRFISHILSIHTCSLPTNVQDCRKCKLTSPNILVQNLINVQSADSSVNLR